MNAYRRLLHQGYLAAGYQNHWAYHFEVPPPLGLNSWLGVFHAEDLLYVFGVPKLIAKGIDIGTLGLSKLVPKLVGKLAFSDKEAAVSTTMINYW